MAIQKLKLAEDDVSVEINIKELLGEASKNEVIREVFFQAAFDKMLKRLDQGRGVDGKLQPYSKSYKDSLSYKVFGKSSTVNMQLTGDMINSVQVKDESASKMTIGFSDSENAKAYAHMTGFKGHPTLDGKVKPRNFFGWTDKELKEIATVLKTAEKKSAVNDDKILSLLDRLTNG